VTEGKVFRRVSKNGTRQDEGVTTDVVWYAVKRYAIHAPSSTKNSTGTRDPEMHQTRKGNQWYFGMKAHIGVDSREGIVHSLCSTVASVADKHMLPDLLHGNERKVWGDGAYQGQGEAIRKAAPRPGHDFAANQI
jgi:IS5 family transposase